MLKNEVLIAKFYVSIHQFSVSLRIVPTYIQKHIYYIRNKIRILEPLIYLWLCLRWLNSIINFWSIIFKSETIVIE